MTMRHMTKALLAGAGLAGIATVARRRHRDPGGVVAVTVLRPPEAIASAWDGAPAAGELDLAPAPAGRGTEVRVRPAGDDADGDEGQERDRLRRVKATLEAGEVITTEGQPSGRGPVAEAVTAAVSRRLRAWSGS